MTPSQLLTIRKKLDLTQTQLAKALGVTRSTVARWESGELAIERRTQLAVEHLLCKALLLR